MLEMLWPVVACRSSDAHALWCIRRCHRFGLHLPCREAASSCDLPICVVEPERVVLAGLPRVDCVDAESGAMVRTPSIV